MNRETLLKILDLARWAPSGDNTQPWHFEIVSDKQIAIHAHDTRDTVLYDFDGHPSQMAHGALLETLRLAATRFGLKAEWIIRPGQPDSNPIYDVTLHPAAIAEDSLVPFIEKRTVQRRAMSTTRLQQAQKDTLESAVGDGFSLQFFESIGERLQVAKLLWDNAHIRLTCPEAFPVHRDIIEWGARFSTDRIPEQAVGVDPMTAKLMKWVMRDWARVAFFNRYLMGTIAPRIQLDFIPALACAGHVLLRPSRPPSGLVDQLSAGVALQRLWLTASALGLHLQPEMTPVIFRWYARSGRRFSALPNAYQRALSVSGQFEHLAHANQSAHFSFFCRVGECAPPRSRSMRKGLEALLADGKQT